MVHVILDTISEARLKNTIGWARVARQECEDLALDAPVNPGLEVLEEYADAAAEALRKLEIAAHELTGGTQI